MDAAENEYVNNFFSRARDFIDESSSDEKEIRPETAAALAVLDIYGKSRDLIKSDGAGDRGIDWYTNGENECEIWQFKCRNELDHEAYSHNASPKDLYDLSRILDWLSSIGSGKKEANKTVKKFQERLETNLRKKAGSEEALYYFNINLFVGCKELTAQARDELSDIKKRAKALDEIKVGEQQVLIDIQIRVICIPDIVKILKATENPDWFDVVANKKDDKVALSCDKMIDDKKCQIFFTPAINLVDAYRRFGYRLFEPNVRCYLQSSRVNEAIRDSLNAMKGITNFKYLNNGVTIFYQNINKNKGNNHLTFTKPGVVNGLQTIKTLSEVYSSYTDPAKKKHFEENCYVQVRAFKQESGIPVEDIIISTNNQNKMNQRNLESNTQVQKDYEYMFAGRGWFYERKDGGWEAFAESSTDWPGLVGKRASHFGGKQKKDRRVISNEDVAVAWLAFSGYSDIARSERRKIFENQRIKQRCFELLPGSHGYYYGFDRNGPFNDQDSKETSPPVDLLLLASLFHLSLKNVLPTKSQTDQKYISKYSLENLNKEQQQATLLDKPDYIAELMMVSAPLTFVELCGFIFLNSVNGNYENFSKAVLNSNGLREVASQKDFSIIKTSIEKEQILKNDFFVSVYFLWKYMWEELASSSVWRNSLLADSSRPSFAHKKEHRTKMIERVIEIDKNLVNAPMYKTWSARFDENKTILNIIREELL